MKAPPPPLPAPHASSTRFVQKYLSWIFLLIALVVLSVFWGFHFKATSMLREQVQGQGRAFFTGIVLNREWIANHGGVYVRMTPGMESNPWLPKVPGLKTEIRDEKGETYTLKNPALVTREISELAEEKRIFRFRITSDRPLNPANSPDPFEQASLVEFGRGAQEHSDFEERDGKTFFRYMAPLKVQDACLRCHAVQGYHTGDVRGGISVTIDASSLTRQIWIYRGFLALSAAAILGIIYGIITAISRAFLRDLRTAEDRLVEMATRDSLTGLLTRRETMRLAEWEHGKAARMGRPLSAILVDIDHFKAINDTRGHSAGDAALADVAHTIRATLRGYDILCRYGGEEFLAITPETTLEQAEHAAERLRQALEARPVPIGGEEPVRLTASAGVALMQPGETVERLIARADAALYAAKQAGRNRVCAG
jgi:diguanylate cyclase (GGDEF)-like protein